MIVMKFGAAALGEAARLRDLVRVVKSGRDAGYPVAVVCTAQAGITDALIDAARAAAERHDEPVKHARNELWGRHRALVEKLIDDEWEREELFHAWSKLLRIFDNYTRSFQTLGELSPRGIDMVAVLGERFMAHLVAVVLRRSGIASQMADGADLIVTDAHFGNAHPLVDESFERIRARLQAPLKALIVPVVTGYVGATRDGYVTTLGRGGGDYSATLIGAALGATEVCLWTDVDGILTADPKLVPNARTLSEISYAEAAEIAALGAEVLHPHTLAPLQQRGIPLHIRNLSYPDRPGTRVVTAPHGNGLLARAIISAGGLSMLNAAAHSDDVDWGPAITRMTESSVNMLSFTQSLSERSLTLAVRAADAPFARECLAAAIQHSVPDTTAPDITLASPVGLVALITTPSAELLLPRVLSSLGRAGAQIYSLARGAAHISFLLPESQLDSVVRTLHADLGLAA
jgi:aspartate kinase